jgi:phosphoglycolate phosphatase-like HAD superfamily hydrolase
VGEDGLTSALRKVGARIVSDREADGDGDNSSQFPVDCVVAGIDRHFTYDKLRLAQRFIMNGARFVATNRDSTFPVADGVVPGAGSIVAAIETASGVTPMTVGKPQPLMMHLLLQKFGLVPGETAMVGDRLDTDIVAARRAGIGAIFVATGVNTLAEAQGARGEYKADALFENLPALCVAMNVPAGVAASTRSTAPLAPLADEPETVQDETPTVSDARNSSVEELAASEAKAEGPIVPDLSDSKNAGNWWESLNGSYNGRHKPSDNPQPDDE